MTLQYLFGPGFSSFGQLLLGAWIATILLALYIFPCTAVPLYVHVHLDPQYMSKMSSTSPTCCIATTDGDEGIESKDKYDIEPLLGSPSLAKTNSHFVSSGWIGGRLSKFEIKIKGMYMTILLTNSFKKKLYSCLEVFSVTWKQV
jgi:hypothetical protein